MRWLQALCGALIDDPASPLSLAEWAARVGASERTLAWLFASELKMSFGAWRQQLRLARALDLIGRGRPCGEVAAELGYASQAAFFGHVQARLWRAARPVHERTQLAARRRADQRLTTELHDGSKLLAREMGKERDRFSPG